MSSRRTKSKAQKKSSLQSKTAIVNKKSRRPSEKRKQWTEESMLSAIKAVEDGESPCC